MNHHTTNAPPLLSSHLQSFNTWYINTFFPVLSVWVILEVFILPDVQQKKKIWPKVWIDHAFTFYCGFGLLGNKMALPQSQILTIPQWFLLLSGSHIVVITFFFFYENYFFILLTSPTLFFIRTSKLTFVWGLFRWNTSHQWRKQVQKFYIVTKTGYNKPLGCQGKE